MEIIEKSKYWEDESTGNKLSKSKYSKNNAKVILEQLSRDNCTDCLDCERCIDCKDCTNCEKCTDCYDCHDCSFCSNSNHCNDCNDCKECDSCHDCDDCKKCEVCFDCKECKSCENCDEMSYIENEKNLNDTDSVTKDIEDEENGMLFIIQFILSSIFLFISFYVTSKTEYAIGSVWKISAILPIFIFYIGILSSIFPGGDDEILIDGTTTSPNITWSLILTVVSSVYLAKLDFLSEISGSIMLSIVVFFMLSLIATARIIGYRLSFFKIYLKTLWLIFVSLFWLLLIMRGFEYIKGLF